jgi:hypothetical protein
MWLISGKPHFISIVRQLDRAAGPFRAILLIICAQRGLNGTDLLFGLAGVIAIIRQLSKVEPGTPAMSISGANFIGLKHVDILSM